MLVCVSVRGVTSQVEILGMGGATKTDDFYEKNPDAPENIKEGKN